MERPWERIIPLEERNLYRQHGYGFKSEEEIVARRTLHCLSSM